jgi:DNA-binding LacI/PurR family transcriptional regulator
MDIDPESPIALYAQLVNHFRARILSKEYPPGSRLSSELELAEHYNISRGTIRQAMNILVNEGLIERVAGKGTFVKDIDAASTKLIGVLLPSMRDALAVDILVGVEQAAKRRDYHVMFAHTEERLEQEAADIQRMREEHVAGFILFPLTNLPYDEAVAGLVANNVPVVLVDRYFPNLPTDVVAVDNTDGGYLATRHLIEHGHRRVGFVAASSMETTSMRDRFEGYKQALAQQGLAYEDALLFNYPLEANSDGLRAYLSAPNRPSALFISNDFTAMRVLRVADELGLRVPEDLAIVGFDNVKEAAELSVPLTTIAQSGVQIGKRACELLLARIENPNKPHRREFLPVELIVRRSCGATLS